jgi:hypothetical protein
MCSWPFGPVAFGPMAKPEKYTAEDTAHLMLSGKERKKDARPTLRVHPNNLTSSHQASPFKSSTTFQQEMQMSKALTPWPSCFLTTTRDYSCSHSPWELQSDSDTGLQEQAVQPLMAVWYFLMKAHLKSHVLFSHQASFSFTWLKPQASRDVLCLVITSNASQHLPITSFPRDPMKSIVFTHIQFSTIHRRPII